MVLVTGGAGYIGSHTCVELLNAGYKVVVIDNLTNSSAIALERVQRITNKSLYFYEFDMRDSASLITIFRKHNIEAVIHFAGLKAVKKSIERPLEYYNNNVGGTITLLEVMQTHCVKTIIFSSSATVYGEVNPSPFVESMPISYSKSPYGQTKIAIEGILKDVYRADPSWHISILRYFNPIGAHPSGLIGEDPNGIPSNLCPYITQVAIGKQQYLHIFGSDYDTPDGTAIRDYIHVMDLANGHISALKKAEKSSGLDIYNLGTGEGKSVLDVLLAFENIIGKPIPYKFESRRIGDLASIVANPIKASEELGWQSQYNLGRMAEDSWRWQSKNPEGYRT